MLSVCKFAGILSQQIIHISLVGVAQKDEKVGLFQKRAVATSPTVTIEVPIAVHVLKGDLDGAVVLLPDVKIVGVPFAPVFVAVDGNALTVGSISIDQSQNSIGRRHGSQIHPRHGSHRECEERSKQNQQKLFHVDPPSFPCKSTILFVRVFGSRPP